MKQRNMMIFRIAAATFGLCTLAGCGTKIDRTLFGPDLPENSRAAQIAHERGYPNVFTGEEERPPLLTPEEREAEKKRLERAGAAARSR